MRHVLFVIEPVSLMWEGEDQLPNLTPPAVDPSLWSRIVTHYTYFSHCFSRANINGFVAEKLGVQSFGDNRYPADHTIATYDPVKNEERDGSTDAEIIEATAHFFADNPDWRESMPEWWERDSVFPPRMERHRADFQRIADIMNEFGVDYRVIVGPNRSAIRMAPADKAELSAIFGDNLIDLTETHSWVTKVTPYYLDGFHYYPLVADTLMSAAYNHRFPAGN